MTVDAIEDAISEAKRFLRLASGIKFDRWTGSNTRYIKNGPKDTGALRRASMDLTRALAQMRKP